MSVLAKFYVSAVERKGYSNFETGEPQETSVKVNLSTIHAPKDKDPASENFQFWKATPQGQCWMEIDNPQAFDHFQPGECEYVLFVNAQRGMQGLIEQLEVTLERLKVNQDSSQS